MLCRPCGSGCGSTRSLAAVCPWQVATQHGPLEGLQVAGVVETLLRVVTGLQASACLVNRQTLTDVMGHEHFASLTLGNLRKLTAKLRDELKARPIPGLSALGTWPDKQVEGLLEAIGGRRNQLAHPGPMTPSGRDQLARAIAADTVKVLESLAWMRDLEWTVFTEGNSFGAGRGLGREQVFRGAASHPPARRVSWEGRIHVGRTYVRYSAEGGRCFVLDVEPFFARERLGRTLLEELCVWCGVTRNGEVRIRELTSSSETTRPVDTRPRLLKIKIYAVPQSNVSLTRHEGEALQAPTLLGVETASRQDEPARETRPAGPLREALQTDTVAARRTRRLWPWAVALSAVTLVALGLVLAQSLHDDPPRNGGASPSSLEQSASPARGVPPPGRGETTCAPDASPDLGEAWTFDTLVLGHAPGMEYGLHVSGHYEVEFFRAGCEPRARLVKTGWTQKGTRHDRRQLGESGLDVSWTTRSAASRFVLVSESPEVRPAEIDLRWARHGPFLIALWRSAGDDFERSGYWGTAFGRPKDSRDPRPATTCFEACGRLCFAGGDPLDDMTETCLLRCGQELDASPAKDCSLAGSP